MSAGERLAIKENTQQELKGRRQVLKHAHGGEGEPGNISGKAQEREGSDKSPEHQEEICPDTDLTEGVFSLAIKPEDKAQSKRRNHHGFDG